MTEYKINSNKSVAFLYTNDKWAEKENRKTAPFTLVKNNIKYLWVTVPKQVKFFYDRTSSILERNQRTQKMERYPMIMDCQD